MLGDRPDQGQLRDRAAAPARGRGHARLQFFGNEWWLIDCDSANGTYLLVEDAGRPIEMGDMFRIARCEVQLFAVPTQGAAPAGTAP